MVKILKQFSQQEVCSLWDHRLFQVCGSLVGGGAGCFQNHSAELPPLPESGLSGGLGLVPGALFRTPTLIPKLGQGSGRIRVPGAQNTGPCSPCPRAVSVDRVQSTLRTVNTWRRCGEGPLGQGGLEEAGPRGLGPEVGAPCVRGQTRGWEVGVPGSTGVWILLMLLLSSSSSSPLSSD